MGICVRNKLTEMNMLMLRKIDMHNNYKFDIFYNVRLGHVLIELGVGRLSEEARSKRGEK